MAVIPLTPRNIVRSDLCIGCGSCVAQHNLREHAESGAASVPDAGVGTAGVGAARAAMAMNEHGLFVPGSSVPSGQWTLAPTLSFSRTCPFSPNAADENTLARENFADSLPREGHIGVYAAAYVGHVREDGFRDRGSSGGLGSWVLHELLNQGLVDGVAHVAAVPSPSPEGPFFRYRIARTAEEIMAGAKSRYYPVHMAEILEEIAHTPGRYAVVGVPCFIKAVQLLRKENPLFRERIRHTVGLFCGHMKSARMLESFAWQCGAPSGQIERAEFRIKDPERPASTYTAQFTLRDGTQLRKDWWFLAEGDWGSGFFQSPACNYCDDVVGETADISLGDAWVEPYASDGRGTNVVVTRSVEINELLQQAIAQNRLQLEPVGPEFVVETQAAGFRQRREGLAYRLTWRKRGIRPRKRVLPSRTGISLRRKLVYRSRAHISFWSHRMYRLARTARRQALYLTWGRAVLAVYQALTYSRGRLGQLVNRLWPQ